MWYRQIEDRDALDEAGAEGVGLEEEKGAAPDEVEVVVESHGHGHGHGHGSSHGHGHGHGR
jgi:hypothetical protein